MGTTQAVPRKHIGKKVTAEQEKVIDYIRTTKKLRTMAEAKHDYFENQATWDAVWTDHDAREEVAAAIAGESKDPELEEPEKAVKRKPKTIAETKLGVTMVLDHEDCKRLGFTLQETTGYAIDVNREKLGLETRAARNERRAAERAAERDKEAK